MASIEAKRIFISRQYGGNWAEKVKNMPDGQVCRIYDRIMDEIDSVKRKKQKPKISETEVAGGIQLCLFENRKSLKIKEGYLV